MVEAGRSGRLSRWTGVTRPEEGGESGENIGAAQSNGGGWEGSRDTEGDGDGSINILKQWGGDR